MKTYSSVVPFLLCFLCSNVSGLISSFSELVEGESSTQDILGDFPSGKSKLLVGFFPDEKINIGYSERCMGGFRT